MKLLCCTHEFYDQIWPTSITPKKGDMCSHKSSLLHNVANAILVPCGSTGLWILVFGTESHPTSWCNSKTHGANTLLPLWWHSTLWANLSTCRILSTLFVVATKLKATTREMKDQPQTKIFRPWAPIAARRLIFVAHEKKKDHTRCWQPYTFESLDPSLLRFLSIRFRVYLA